MGFAGKALVLFGLLTCFGCAVAVEEAEQDPGPPGQNKIAICHKGKKTQYVPEAALKAHLNHGDYLGECR